MVFAGLLACGDGGGDEETTIHTASVTGGDPRIECILEDTLPPSETCGDGIQTPGELCLDDFQWLIDGRVYEDNGWLSDFDLCDIEGDGDVDIVASWTGRHYKTWAFENDGALRFLRREIFPNVIRSISCGQVIPGGPQEIAANANNTRVWRRNEIGSFEVMADLAGDDSVEPVRLGDLDGDGAAEVVSNWRGGRGPRLFRWNGSTFDEGERPLGAVDGVYPRVAAIRDIDGDGLGDLVLRGSALVFYWGQQDAPWIVEDPYVVAFSPPLFGPAFDAGDADGDGYLDFLVTDPETGSVAVVPGAANRTVGDVLHRFQISCSPSHARFGDLDGDGDLDVLASTSFYSFEGAHAGVNGLTFVENRGGFDFSGRRSMPRSAPPGDLRLHDLDGDGDLDAVVSGDDGLQILLNRP